VIIAGCGPTRAMSAAELRLHDVRYSLWRRLPSEQAGQISAERQANSAPTRAGGPRRNPHLRRQQPSGHDPPLAEPSAHDDDLFLLAYQLMDAAGLQRGRLTALALRDEDLISADQVARQISLDGAREARLVAEAVSDHVRDKFGTGGVGGSRTSPASREGEWGRTPDRSSPRRTERPEDGLPSPIAHASCWSSRAPLTCASAASPRSVTSRTSPPRASSPTSKRPVTSPAPGSGAATTTRSTPSCRCATRSSATSASRACSISSGARTTSGRARSRHAASPRRR
jgi:hypothetical protein